MMNALAIMQSDELDTIQRTARLLAVSGYFDAKGDNAQSIAMVATKIMAGREIGIGPFASVNGIHIISGKPAIGANLMAGAVKQSGRYDYRVRELTNEVCKIEYFERNGEKWESIGVSEFTKADARVAGTKNMDKYPKNMLFARAMSNGVRWYTPDIFSGNVVYVPEELGAEVDGDGNVVDVTPRIVEDATEKPDAIFNDPAPYYVADWNKLTGKEYDLVKWVRDLHKTSDDPCTEKQYQYLTSIINKLTNNEHNYALSLLCQSHISSDNMPGAKVATKLFDLLLPTVTEKSKDGTKVESPNANYRQDIAEMITSIVATLVPVAA
jgi:hypothetical protein